MEQIKQTSIKLRNEILPQVEVAIKGYVYRVNKLYSNSQINFERELDDLNERLDKIKIKIECDEAAISFIKSQVNEKDPDKENNCPKKIIYKKVEKSRENAAYYSGILRMYEKRLGLSLKKLTDDTLWISFQYIKEDNFEHSAIIKVDSGRYVLIKCTPVLDNINTLLDALNSNNRFSDFIKQLRKSFKNNSRNQLQ